jgi:hypothetical protein
MPRSGNQKIAGSTRFLKPFGGHGVRRDTVGFPKINCEVIAYGSVFEASVNSQ